MDVELLRWEAKDKKMIDRKHREEATKKEHKEEEREKKLERARRVKAAMEENPDALRKGK